jgi:Flp pilus assembly protein TadG
VNRYARHALRRALGEETGAIAVIVALFMVGLLVIAALVLDLGTGYDHDRELQSAADAGALAGAMELILPAGSPAAATRSYVAQNVAPGDPAASVQGGNVSFQKLQVAARSVTVDLRENHVPFNFAQVIGTSEGAVSAHAKAELMYLTAMPIVAPAPIPYLDPAHFTVHVGHGTGKDADLTQFDLTGSPGLYSGSGSVAGLRHTPDDFLLWLTGVDEAGNDIMAPFPVGSVYVPSADSVIRSVELGRPGAGSTSEHVTVTVQTEGMPPNIDGTPIDTIPLQWRINNNHGWNLEQLHRGSNDQFSGSFTVSPGGSYINGTAMITIQTGDAKAWEALGIDWHALKEAWHPDPHEWKDHDVLAMFTMFDEGQSIRYFKQSGYTTSPDHGGSVQAWVGTRVFDMNGGEATIDSKDMFFQNSFGPTGWGDMLAGASFGEEIQIALGETQAAPSLTLLCDGNGNKQADLGEWLPVDPTVRTGAWIGGLSQAVGKVLFVALVDPGFEEPTPPTNLHAKYNVWFQEYKNWWKPKKPPAHPPKHPKPGWDPNYPTDVQISHLGAFQVDSVVDAGAGNFTMTGHFVRYLSAGTWTDVKPDGVYVETAVLTE